MVKDGEGWHGRETKNLKILGQVSQDALRSYFKERLVFTTTKLSRRLGIEWSQIFLSVYTEKGWNRDRNYSV